MAAPSRQAFAAALVVALAAPTSAGAVTNEIAVTSPAGQPVNATVAITLQPAPVSGALLVDRSATADDVTSIPQLGRLPVIGHLFSGKSSSAGKHPLIVVRPPIADHATRHEGQSGSTALPKPDAEPVLVIVPHLVDDPPPAEDTASDPIEISPEIRRQIGMLLKDDAERLQAEWELERVQQIPLEARLVSTATWAPRDLGFDPGAYGGLLEGAGTAGLGKGAGGTPWVGTTGASGRVSVDTDVIDYGLVGMTRERERQLLETLLAVVQRVRETGGFVGKVPPRMVESVSPGLTSEERDQIVQILTDGLELVPTPRWNPRGFMELVPVPQFRGNSRALISAGTDWDSASTEVGLDTFLTGTTLAAQISAEAFCRQWCIQTASGQVQSEPELSCRVKLPAIVAQAGAVPAATGPGGEAMRAQWAFKKLGLPLPLPWKRLAPVTVAVIDTGLDYRHPALRPHHIWANPRPGADPRHPDDVLGWNFVAGHNNPWDDSGHGTFVAGLILAVNPRARIMPIKVMDTFGSGVTSDVARAVLYAVDRGARVINLSLGAEGVSRLSQEVVDYARARGAVIVAAAGNESADATKHVPANLKGVLTVGASDESDRKPGFANYGQPVALVAPAVDVVSLRARGSDFVLLVTGGKDYTRGRNIVGTDRWHYRATGTSFSAPLVAGAASLLLSLRPSLTGPQVERMLIESADDVETPGWDQFSGNGRLNIARAIAADPNRSLVARIARLTPAQQGGRTVVQIFGAADGNTLASYQLQLGHGESPTGWKTVGVERGKSVPDGLLGAFPAAEITARGKWTVRVIAQDTAGRTREARGTLDVQ